MSRRSALACSIAAMSFCSFFGGEVFQNHFEPGTACGIKAGIAFWLVVESPSQDGATVAAEGKRAWERRTSGEGAGEGWSRRIERRGGIPVLSVFLGAGLELQCRSHWGSSGPSALGWYYPYGFRVVGTWERNDGGMWSKVRVGVCPDCVFLPGLIRHFPFSPECAGPGVSPSSLLAVSEV